MYANGLRAPFVLDDDNAIVENVTIRSLRLGDGVLSPPAQSSVAGRPLVNLSLAVNYAVGGLEPFGFHVVNLAIHLTAALVLFGILRRTLRSPAVPASVRESADAAAFAGALLWTIHPLQTELVNYTTQRTESLMGLWYLVTVYAVIRGAQATRGTPWYAAAVGACALGMLSKESMLSAPVMVLVYDRVFLSFGVRESLRRRGWLYAGLAATWLVAGALMWSGPRSDSAGFGTEVTPLNYLFNQTEMIAAYLQRTAWPRDLVLDYGPPFPMSLGEAMPFGLAIVALVGITIGLWWVSKPAAFAATWLFVTLAPTSSFIPLATEVGAERRMYLPLAALLPLVGVAAWVLVARAVPSRARTSVAGCALAVVSGLLGVFTLERNAEYHRESGIWQTVWERYPHPRALYHLGLALEREGRRADAVRHYRDAVPRFPEAHYFLAVELEEDGRHDEAIAEAREYLAFMRDDTVAERVYELLGRSLLAEGRADEAADVYREVLASHPRHAVSARGLADAYREGERFEQAVAAYQAYLTIEPADASAYSGMGIAYVALARGDDAVRAFGRAADLAPNDPAVIENFALCLADVGRFEDAEAQYRRALALAPGAAGLHAGHGAALVALGRTAEAIASFRRTVDLAGADIALLEAARAAIDELSRPDTAVAH